MSSRVEYWCLLSSRVAHCFWRPRTTGTKRLRQTPSGTRSRPPRTKCTLRNCRRESKCSLRCAELLICVLTRNRAAQVPRAARRGQGQVDQGASRKAQGSHSRRHRNVSLSTCAAPCGTLVNSTIRADYAPRARQVPERVTGKGTCTCGLKQQSLRACLAASDDAARYAI